LLFVPPLTKFFQFRQLNVYQLFVSIGIGFLSVAWYELVKWRKRMIGKGKKVQQ
jgi:Ca2+-transporting ATPase